MFLKGERKVVNVTFIHIMWSSKIKTINKNNLFHIYEALTHGSIIHYDRHLIQAHFQILIKKVKNRSSLCC